MKKRQTFQSLHRERTQKYISLLLGARQVGKTTILKQLQKQFNTNNETCLFVNLENPDYKKACNQHPDQLFQITGSQPYQKQIVCIDEIQLLDDPSNFLKYLYDEYHETLKLYVTGSSAFYISQKFNDSLIGRKKITRIHPLNFHEYLDFQNENLLLSSIQQTTTIPLMYKQTIQRHINNYTIYGWYPEIALIQDLEEKKDRLKEYARDFAQKDAREAKLSFHDKLYEIMQILAAQIGQLVNNNQLANDINLQVPSISKYIHVLEKSFHITLIKPFHKNLKKELTKMRKVYFHDIGIRNSILDDFRPLHLRPDKGNYIENIYFSLLAQNHHQDDIRFRRTKDKHEIDFIIEKKQAHEVKYRHQTIKKTTQNLFQKNYPDIQTHTIDRETIQQHMIFPWTKNLK